MNVLSSSVQSAAGLTRELSAVGFIEATSPRHRSLLRIFFFPIFPNQMQILHNKQLRWALDWLAPDVFRWFSLIFSHLMWEYLKSGSERF